MTRKLILTFLAGFPLQSFAWGAVGHRAVALIAEDELTREAKAEIRDLLGDETLEDVAYWADVLRSTGTYQQARWYHFETLPDFTTYLQHLKDMPDRKRKRGGVVSSILAAMDILRDAGESRALRRDALKFLVHFVGDIHQPLHSGRPEDFGGLKIEVEWFGHASTLHSVWDTLMLFTGHAGFLNFAMTQAEASAGLHKYLVRTQDRKRVSTDIDVEAWLNESIALRASVYETTYKTDQYRYQKLRLPILDQRIFASGIRLAAVLNSLFASKAPEKKEIHLRQGIEDIVGDIRKLIWFTP